MKLITWNIQWGRGADGRIDLDRIVAQARRLADFDVLCLQEVAAGYPDLPGSGDGGVGDQFQALADLLPGYAAIAAPAVEVFAPAAAAPAAASASTPAPLLAAPPSAPSPAPAVPSAPAPGSRRAFGNMILSRLPVGQVWRHLLPWPADPGVKSMQRVMVEATVEAPWGGALRVCTTHLEYYSAPQRMAQVERLRELHREAVAHARSHRPGAPADGPFDFVPRGGPAVLTGDFNFRPDRAEHARMLAPFDGDEGDATPPWRDAWQFVYPGEPHAPTVGLFDKEQWPGEPFACDFVFVSDDLAPRVRTLRVDAAADGSDHQPVLLELG